MKYVFYLIIWIWKKNTTFKIIINSSYIILPINCSIILK